MVDPGEVVKMTVVAPAVSAEVARQPAYQRWLEREPLASCGDHTMSPKAPEMWMPNRPCLEEALAKGTGAESVVTASTVEGDPIVTYVRVTPAGETEVYRDATQDRFGSREWSYSRCPDLQSALEVRC